MELLLVMAILTLVVAAVMPSFRGFTSGRNNKYAATQFLSMTRYARTQAVSEARTYRLVYDSQTRAFSLMTDNGGGVFEAARGDIAAPLTISEDITVTADFPSQEDGVYLQFFASGLIEQAAVTFTNSAGNGVTVVASSPTEQFRIAREGEIVSIVR